MAYVNSNRSRLSFVAWIKSILIHPNLLLSLEFQSYSDAKPRVELESIFKGSLLKTYGFDGYVSSTTQITLSNGAENSFANLLENERLLENQASFFLPWVILNFFGIPSRPGEDYWQIIRNFFGGWDSLWDYSGFNMEGKRLWNIVALPIKLGVILPLKLIGVLFKLALNVVKLFTEFLPELIVNSTCLAIYHLGDEPDTETLPGFILSLILRFVLRVVLGIVHYAARILLLFGTAFTSPEKSARDAWEFGRSLDVPVLGFLCGVIGATISIAITTALWMLFLPLAVNQIIVLIPQVIPVLTAISQWPIVTSCVNIAQGIYSVLPAAFSAVGSALGTALGVSINTMVLTLTVSITSIAGLATAIGSRIADKLSNTWTYWEPDMNLGEGLRAMTEIRNNEYTSGMYCYESRCAHHESTTQLLFFSSGSGGNTYNFYGNNYIGFANDSYYRN